MTSADNGGERRLKCAAGLLAVAIGAGALVAWTSSHTAVRRDDPVVTAGSSPRLAPAAAIERSRATAPRGGASARRPAPTTVRRALKRARLRGAIDERTYRARLRTLRAARRLVVRLPGTLGREMGAAVATVERLAARRLLTVDRLRVAFLTLRRNLDVWRRGRVPAPGTRFTFGRDPAVFQYFPGRGLAFHPLASFGRVNARARNCLERHRCHARALRRALDRLAGLAVRRGGFPAWEYLVAFGGGTPPWISAMAQATEIQALARGGEVLGSRRWRPLTEQALGAFEQPPPAGVRVDLRGGTYYAMYSFAPSLRILNGSLQTLLGLYDEAELSGSARARRLFRAAEPTAREAVLAHDTGSWTLYARDGAESPLNYHRLLVTELAGLCARLAKATYCDARRRFARYERTPPAVRLTWGGQVRRGAPAPVVFWLSRSASVRLRIRRAGRTELLRELHAGPARHAVAWTPRRTGRYHLTLSAVGVGAARAVRRASLEVRRPQTRHRRRGGKRRVTVRRPRRGAARTPAATPSPAAPEQPAPPLPAATPTPDPTRTPDPVSTPDPVATPDAAATPDSTATPAPTPASGAGASAGAASGHPETLRAGVSAWAR